MRPLAILAALSGAIAVAAGALGAHGFAGEPAEWLKTGAQYQMVHAVAALVALRNSASGVASCFLVGGVIFSGTLYAMALGAPRLLGAVTPVGGILLIAGWLLLGLRAYRTA